MTADDFDARVKRKLANFEPILDQMEGAKRILLADGLADYCRIAVQLEDVNESVRRTGTTIVNNKGNVVRNPDLMTQHQLVNEKNALMPKLLKYLPEPVEVDALAAF